MNEYDLLCALSVRNNELDNVKVFFVLCQMMKKRFKTFECMYVYFQERMSTTGRLKNLVISLSGNKKKLNEIDTFIFKIEYKEMKKSNIKSSILKTPPIKQRVVLDDVEYHYDSKFKFDPELMEKNIVEKEKMKSKLRKFQKEEKLLQKHRMELEKYISYINSRISNAEDILKTPLKTTKQMEKVVNDIEATVERLNGNDLSYTKPSIMGEQLGVDIIEAENSERRMKLEERRDYTLSFTALSPCHSQENFKLGEEQLAKKEMIIRDFNEIDDLKEKYRMERERIEEEYRKKVERANELSKNENVKNDIILQLHMLQNKYDILEDKNKNNISLMCSHERSMKSLMKSRDNSFFSDELNVQSEVLKQKQLIIDEKMMMIAEKKKSNAKIQNEINILSDLLSKKEKNIESIEKESESLKAKISKQAEDVL